MAAQGSSPPIVLIPGIQGRWEWMTPAIRALERHHLVFTFSLGEARGPNLFDAWMSRIDALLDAGAHRQAALVGVSFGGLVALWYAANRPDRVSNLVLVASPSPRWTLDVRLARYVRHPRLSLPLFALGTVRRLTPELAAAMPGIGKRTRFVGEYGLRALRYPASPRQMAGFVGAWQQTDLASAAGRVKARTLIITGEDGLDRVVAVSSTKEYLSLIPGAAHVTLSGTGHIGCVSKPREFAALVTDFIDAR